MRKKITHNEYRPHFKFFRSPGFFPTNLCFGYELEVQGRDVEHIINRYPHLYAKDESSVDGCEINTHPFNWNWWLRNNGIQYVNEIRSGSGCSVNRACGFHIHLSRSWFSRQHLIRMAKLFYANPKFIEHVSQRVKARSTKNWTLLKNAANPWILEEMIRCCVIDAEQLKDKDFNNPELCKDIVDGIYEERSVALNFCNRDTIEIRIFQSTLNPKLIQAYLEFALACAIYTRNIRFQDVSVAGLKRFVRHNPWFPNLHRSHLLYDCRYSWRG